MTYHAMMFFWMLSEKHWLLKPFEMIGDFLEDWGLEHGHIKFKREFMEGITKAKANE